MRSIQFIIISAIMGAFIITGCGGPPPPLDEIRETVKGIPTCSVVLDDMKVEGNFFKDYYHKYKVITAEKTVDMGWMATSEKVYQRYLPFLGMTIWSKQDGKESSTAGPAGYEYVGNRKYGSWQRDSSGNSFWVFYGQYRLISDLLGGGRIYRNGYDSYRSRRSRGMPYYGPKNEYGTNGALTKKRKPDFYSRAMSRKASSKTSFSDKFNKRIGRSRSGFSGRSGGRGK
ncbi:MAG: hypothetical protein GY850_38395 [bacterium]|nr:hypothetical protein [bacterium]